MDISWLYKTHIYSIQLQNCMETQVVIILLKLTQKKPQRSFSAARIYTLIIENKKNLCY